LEQLRRYNADNTSLENMIALEAYGRMVSSGFQSRGLAVPEWLENTLSALASDIGAKSRDELMRQLKEAEAQESALLSRDERRARATQRAADLRKQLGLADKPVATAPSA
jgi:hypothetical protein